MSCTTCSHTLYCIHVAYQRAFWHCARCGTLLVRQHGFGSKNEIIVPKLVERCRTFQLSIGSDLLAHWTGLGVAESIQPPEERKTP